RVPPGARHLRPRRPLISRSVALRESGTTPSSRLSAGMPPELTSPPTAYFRDFPLGIALALSREPMARSTRTQTAQSERRTAMVTRVLSITTAVVSLAVSAAVAASLTDAVQATRVTGVQG